MACLVYCHFTPPPKKCHPLPPQIHVMAEGWGLMHASQGEAERRRLVVWKPSRSRKSLKPGMLLDGSDGGGAPAGALSEASTSGAAL